MSHKQKIDALWQEFRRAVNATYKQSTPGNGDGGVLRDYVEDMSWHDDMAKLVGREAANERQHRRGESSPAGFSVDSAAKLILMNAARRGADRDAMPAATEFLVFRQTAVEAEVIGWLVRDHLDQIWRDEVGKIDYAKIMQGARQ